MLNAKVQLDRIGGLKFRVDNLVERLTVGQAKRTSTAVHKRQKWLRNGWGGRRRWRIVHSGEPWIVQKRVERIIGESNRLRGARLKKIVKLRLLVLHGVDYGLIVDYADTAVNHGLRVESIGGGNSRPKILVLRLVITRGVIGLPTQTIGN